MRDLDPVVVHHIVNTLGWRDLHPLQHAAVRPLLAGQDALLLAPTAGGKTEAAVFPLLSGMARERWTGTSVLYLCPLKALLNNLLPRLERYAGWLGRGVALWHGDVTAARRRAVLYERLLLGGRSWRVTYIDWRRRRCFVEAADGGGRARWRSAGAGWAGLGFELSRAVRDVLLGIDPPVKLTRRAVDRLAKERTEKLRLVHPGGNAIVRETDRDLRWWTWAGFRANATLTATLSEVIDPMGRFDDNSVRLRADLTRTDWRDLVADAGQRLCLPEVDEKALAGLKFNAALPKRLAMATLAARLADLDGAAAVLAEPTRWVHG